MLNEVMVKIAALTQMLRARFEQEEGQGMVEYALILVLVSVVALIALGAIGTNVNTIFGTIRDALVAP